MGLLPDTQNCGCACAGNAGNVFPVTTGKRSRRAPRHVWHARAVMLAGIANWQCLLKSAAGQNVPGIPGACATCNFTYLVRGPYLRSHCLSSVRKNSSSHSWHTPWLLHFAQLGSIHSTTHTVPATSKPPAQSMQAPSELHSSQLSTVHTGTQTLSSTCKGRFRHNITRYGAP